MIEVLFSGDGMNDVSRDSKFATWCREGFRYFVVGEIVFKG